MVFNCEFCDYQTTRKYNLFIHNKRLTPCYLGKTKNNTNNDVKLDPIIDPLKINVEEKNHPSKMNVNDPSFQCSKCNKVFTRKDHMKVHEKKRDGFDKRQ